MINWISAEGSKAPFNWLTQSSLDTFTDTFNVTQVMETQSQTPSALLFRRTSSAVKTTPKMQQGFTRRIYRTVQGLDVASRGNILNKICQIS